MKIERRFEQESFGDGRVRAGMQIVAPAEILFF